MSAAKHTPGPWSNEREAGAWSAVSYAYGSSAYEAVVAGDEVVALVVARNPDPFRDPPSTEHNARLIAAAPELLEALQRALNVLDATGAQDEANAARAAIAKAEGTE